MIRIDAAFVPAEVIKAGRHHTPYRFIDETVGTVRFPRTRELTVAPIADRAHPQPAAIVEDTDPIRECGRGDPAGGAPGRDEEDSHRSFPSFTGSGRYVVPHTGHAREVGSLRLAVHVTSG
jgi:hypothetical protein